MSAQAVNANDEWNKNALYGLRFVFVALLMLLHLKWGLYTGGVVVTFFLVIAGFMTAWNNCKRDIVYDKEGALKYYVHKVKKLYPLYFFCTVLAVLRRAYFGGLIVPRNLIMHLLMIKTWVPVDIAQIFELGGANWYISTVMFCYFVTPAIYNVILFLYNKWKKAWMFLVMAGLLWVMQLAIMSSFDEALVAYSIDWWLIYASPFRCVEYCIGMLVGMWYAKTTHKFNANVVSRVSFTILEVGAVILGVCMYKNAWRFSGYVTNGMYWTWFCVLVILLGAEGRGLLSWVLSTQIMVCLGKLNFPIYIMHQEIFAYINILFAGNVFHEAGAPLGYARGVLIFVIVICISDVLNRIVSAKPRSTRAVRNKVD